MSMKDTTQNPPASLASDVQEDPKNNGGTDDDDDEEADNRSDWAADYASSLDNDDGDGHILYSDDEIEDLEEAEQKRRSNSGNNLRELSQEEKDKIMQGSDMKAKLRLTLAVMEAGEDREAEALMGQYHQIVAPDSKKSRKKKEEGMVDKLPDIASMSLVDDDDISVLSGESIGNRRKKITGKIKKMLRRLSNGSRISQ